MRDGDTADLGAREREAILRAIAELALPDGPGAGAGEALYRAIVASLPAMLTVVDPAGCIIWKNQRADMIGLSLYDLMRVEDQPDARAAFERATRTRRSDRFTGLGQGKNGPRSRYENWIAPIVANDQVIAFAMISRDVSEEWELYEALRDREERLSLVLRAAGMGTWRFDLPSRTVEFDEHARVIYGLTTGRLDSLAFTTTHIHPEDRVDVDKRALESAVSRRPYVSQNRIIRTDGVVRWVEVTGSPILDEQGHLVAMMGTITDITDRREIEGRARQAQRLDAVGSLTAGIAHNFNNVLAAIIPALSLIEREVSPSSVSLVRGASLATERAADLVRQLMTFAGRNLSRASTIEAPGALVERTVALCRSTFDRAIDLRVTLDPALPSIRVDVGQVEQALLNLLLNARDAVGQAGRSNPTVHVHVSSAAHPDVPAHRTVVIVVEDNGPGVPHDLRERIFDPFFTTKPVGSGTGLGLATAYAIAREHGGGLTCGGEVGQGARFTLVIPAVDGAPATVAPVTRTAPRAQGNVLVVDDDPFVREAMTRVLDAAGFTVRSAESADQAMAVLAANSVDVVLLDLNMPGSSWRTAVAAIRRDHPTTRVVAFTGGMTEPDSSVDGWLTKPAQPEAIVDTINYVIARSALP